MLGPNPRPVIDDSDCVVAPLSANRRNMLGVDLNLTALHPISESVVHQVLEHLHELVTVAAHHRRALESFHLEFCAHFARERVERILGMAEHVVEVDDV